MERYDVEYFINEEKKTVICKLTNCYNSLQCDMCKAGWDFHPDLFLNDSYIGKAKCSDEDTFDVEFGKKLAYQRAVVKLNTAKTKVLRRFEQNYKDFMVMLLKDINRLSDKYNKIVSSKEEAMKNMFVE